MNQRTIVRSLTTEEGTLVGMNDGLIMWKPNEGRPFRMNLEALPTVLLVVRGPMGNIDLAAIGTASGHVKLLTLPRLELITTFSLQEGSIRALVLANEGTLQFLAGTQRGGVWRLDDSKQTREEHLFSIEGPVSSLHLVDGSVHIQSGWYRHERSLDGSSVRVENTAETYTVRRQNRLDRSYILQSPA